MDGRADQLQNETVRVDSDCDDMSDDAVMESMMKRSSVMTAMRQTEFNRHGHIETLGVFGQGELDSEENESLDQRILGILVNTRATTQLNMLQVLESSSSNATKYTQSLLMRPSENENHESGPKLRSTITASSSSKSRLSGKRISCDKSFKEEEAESQKIFKSQENPFS